jgi:prevent-host-death family protein
MATRFTEDVVSATDLKTSPGRAIAHPKKVGRPVRMTSRGRGVAVMQSVADYECAANERNFIRAAVAGLSDLDPDRELTLREVKSRLGLK